MKGNLKVGIFIAGAVILAAAIPLLVWKLAPSTSVNSSGNSSGRHLTKKQMMFAGYATPEAALQSIAWAAINGDGDKVFACFSPEMQADITKEPNGRAKFNADIKRHAQQLKGMQIMARKMLADDKAELKIKLNLSSPAKNGKPVPAFRIQSMVKVGDDWKLGGSTRDYTPDWDEGSQPESAS
jgi:hypothetical protein